MQWSISQNVIDSESVYLRTNKSVFELGEDLWFSATIVNSQGLFPSNLNTSLFVELREKSENRIVIKEIYEIVDGFSEGHIFLPDTLQQGEYSLFAFTRNSLARGQPIVKSILLKPRIIPSVLINVDFEDAFQSDHGVFLPTVKTVLRSGEPIQNAKINAELWKGNKRQMRFKTTTNAKGNSSLTFTKVGSLDGVSLKVDVTTSNGSEQLFIPIELPSQKKKVQFNLMPEGGSLVSNITSQVAFMAVDQSGLPFEIDSAIVKDERGEIITSFKSQHNGMGSFSFLPFSNKQYTVQIIRPKVDSVYSFPQVQEKGYVLNLFRQSDKQLDFTIKRDRRSNKDSLLFTIEQRGLTLYQSQIIVAGEGLLIQVPTVSFPKGIIKVTIANNKMQTLAERLVFVNQQKSLNISYELNSVNFTTKENVVVKFKVTDHKGLPVQASLGMSVVDEIYASVFDEDHMLSFFFLSNEIQGRVHSPKSYFTEDFSQNLTRLNLLLLTQGWRNYVWSQEVKNPFTAHDLRIAVQMDPESLGKRHLKNLEDQRIQIISVYNASIFNVDNNGEVQLTDSLLYWSKGARIFFKADDLEGVKLKFNTPFDLTGKWGLDHFSFSNRIIKSSKNWNILPQIDNDVTRLDDFVVESSQDGYGVNYGGRGPIFGDNSDYVCMYNILNCRNHLTGRKPKDGEQLMIDGMLRTYVAPRDAIINTTSFTGYYQNPQLYEPDYDAIPENRVFTDFRNSLLWRPNLITDENGEVTVSFFTSDIRSIFNVHIDALGVNGAMGVLEYDIKVLK